jgi:hypothetical protein
MPCVYVTLSARQKQRNVMPSQMLGPLDASGAARGLYKVVSSQSAPINRTMMHLSWYDSYRSTFGYATLQRDAKEISVSGRVLDPILRGADLCVVGERYLARNATPSQISNSALPYHSRLRAECWGCCLLQSMSCCVLAVLAPDSTTTQPVGFARVCRS